MHTTYTIFLKHAITFLPASFRVWQRRIGTSIQTIVPMNLVLMIATVVPTAIETISLQETTEFRSKCYTFASGRRIYCL